MTEINTIITEFIHSIEYEKIPVNTITETKLFIIDYLAACFAGKRMNKDFNRIIEAVIEEDSLVGSCSVFGTDKKYPVATAAFLNAIYCHGADMDDGNKKAMGHVGCHVISTAFAVAEEVKASGKELLTAIVVGYEIYNRVAASVQPGLLHRGFHSTGAAGYLACAAVAAKLYKLSKTEICNAISFAAVQSGGLMIITESGQECKPINPANAARCGIFSAKCAKAGLVASKNIFESEKGWPHAFSGEFKKDVLLDGLGKDYTVHESYMKPYPSCRHTHCSLDCAKEIRNSFINDGYSSEDIKVVDIHIYPNAIRVAGCVKYPQSESETKFSIHYATACMLTCGSFGLDDLVDYNRESVRSVISKIELTEDEKYENVKLGIRGALLTVIMNDGHLYSSEVLSPKGENPNPMQKEDILQKLRLCIGNVEDKYDSLQVYNNVMSIDGLNSINSINLLLTKKGS